MKDVSTKTLVVTALFAALVCVATTIFVFPLTGSGYANLGDCFVIISGCILGPLWGAAAAAIGSALADIFLGYAIFAPATFIIKGLMAATAFAVVKAFSKIQKKDSLTSAIVASITAEVIMVLGYFIYESFLYDKVVAAANLFGNTLQGIVGAFAAVVLLMAIMKSKLLSSFFAFLHKQ